MTRRRRKKKGGSRSRRPTSTSIRSGEQRCVSRKAEIWTKVIREGGKGSAPTGVAQVQVSIEGVTRRPAQSTNGHGRAEFERLDPGAYEVRATLSRGLSKYYVGDPEPAVGRCDLVADATEYVEFRLEPHWIKIAFEREGTEIPITGVSIEAELSDGRLEGSSDDGNEVELRNMREGDATLIQASVEGETWIFAGMK